MTMVDKETHAANVAMDGLVKEHERVIASIQQVTAALRDATGVLGSSAMLTEMEVKDCGRLRDTTVPLRHLTVLIGLNGTGKSAFLNAVQRASGGQAKCIECPENGWHPTQHSKVVSMLRSDVRQVVFVTYSPYLLDHIDIKTDQVLVFQDEGDGSCSVKPIDAKRVEVGFLDVFHLGEVWSCEGEAGLVEKDEGAKT